MKKNRILQEEKGSALPIITLLMVFVLVGIATLVIDAGLAYNQRRELVTAADAAAIAGAGVMEEAMRNGTGTAAAKTYAEKLAKSLAVDNQVEEANVYVSWDNPAYERDTITVKVSADQELIFARFLGFESIQVEAKAVATWGYVTQTESGQILPLFMKDEDYQTENVTYLFFDKLADTSDTAVGNWGLLDIFGSNTSTKEALEGIKKDADISIDGILKNQTGNHGDDLISSIEVRMQTAATLDTVENRQKFMCGMVPIIDWDLISTQGSTLSLPVKAFAVFEIYDVIVKEGNNVNKRSEGSIYAMDTNNYLCDGYTVEYDPVERIVYDNKGELINETTDLKKGTIIGKFTGVEVSLRAVVRDGDQENPDEDIVSATYAKLIE